MAEEQFLFFDEGEIMYTGGTGRPTQKFDGGGMSFKSGDISRVEYNPKAKNLGIFGDEELKLFIKRFAEPLTIKKSKRKKYFSTYVDGLKAFTAKHGISFVEKE